jgi:hypothetical protein
MSGEARVRLGGILSALGMAGWSLALFVFGPQAELTYRTLDDRNKPDHWTMVNWDDLAQMVLWGKDLRWAALVLALGGLLLIAGGRARLYVFAGVLVWLGADLYLDRVGASGWVAALMAVALLAIVLAGALLTAGSRTRRQPASQGNVAIIFYCSIACAFVPLLFWVEPGIKAYRPQGMLVLAAVLSLALAVAAMANAATAARDSRGLRTGLTITGVAAVAMIAVEMASTSLGGDSDQTMGLRLVPMAGIPVLVMGLVIVLNGRPAASGWFGYTMLGVLAGVVAGFGLLGGLVVGYLSQPEIVTLTGGKPFYDGFVVSLSALAAGLGAGFVAWPAAVIRRGTKAARARPRPVNPYESTVPAGEAWV